MLLDQLLDGSVGNRFDPSHEAPEVLADDHRAEPPQQRGGVVEDVAHPVHRVPEQRDPGALQRGHGLRRRGPVAERPLELGGLPVDVITENGTPVRASALA